MGPQESHTVTLVSFALLRLTENVTTVLEKFFFFWFFVQDPFKIICFKTYQMKSGQKRRYEDYLSLSGSSYYLLHV